MRIGAALASFLNEKGKSAADICRATGIKPASMSKYKSGENEPDFETLKLIANELGLFACEIVARAEGVQVDLKNETDEQKQTRLVMESLDAQTRYKIEAIAKIIASDS